MSTNCPRCQKETAQLFDIPSAMQLQLIDISLTEAQFPQVCQDCFRDLKLGVSNPAQLRNRLESEEQKKQVLWSGRGELLKKARQAQDENNWEHSSKFFQSYISSLENVFEQQPGSLTPDTFRAMNKIEEMKSLVLVYWELVQIFDGKNEKWVDEYSRKIVLFGLCSPLKSSLLEKINVFEAKSVFKKYFKRMDRELRGEKGFFSWFKAS